MKKFKGFTLIELIVVIAIIGILAAILVPAMMGWVLRSRITSNNNNAREICTQLQALIADRSTAGDPLVDDGIIVFKNNVFSGVGITLSDEAKDSLKSVNEALTDMTRVVWAAKIEGGYVKAICVSGNDCKAVGGYPVQCPSGSEYKMPGGEIESYIEYAEGSSIWSVS